MRACLASAERLYMGDAGALFLGFMLAVIGIKLRFPENTNLVTWMVPVLVLGVPLFDTGLVIFSRCRRGVNPFTTPGQDHVSHRLVRRGFTQREAVFCLYLFGSFLSLAAIYIMQIEVVEAYQTAAFVILLAISLGWYLEFSPVQSAGKEQE